MVLVRLLSACAEAPLVADTGWNDGYCHGEGAEHQVSTGERRWISATADTTGVPLQTEYWTDEAQTELEQSLSYTYESGALTERVQDIDGDGSADYTELWSGNDTERAYRLTAEARVLITVEDLYAEGLLQRRNLDYGGDGVIEQTEAWLYTDGRPTRMDRTGGGAPLGRARLAL